MHGTSSRFRAAAVVIIIVMLALRFDRLFFILPVMGLLLAGFAAWEVHKLGVHKGIPTSSMCVIGAVLLTMSGVMPPAGFVWCLIPIMSVILAGVLAVQMWRGGTRDAVPCAALTFFGAIYVGLPLALGMQLLFMDRLFFLFVMAAIWSLDSGAYYTGRAFGRHKMAPVLSPKKTWEGALGGLAACVAMCLLFRTIVIVVRGSFELAVMECVLLGVLISVFGMVGDLAESVLKRDAGVKDSGSTMTGHGGVLDRIDSMLFCLPLAYIYLILTGRLPVFEKMLESM